MPIDFPDDPSLTPNYQYTYNGITQNWNWGFSGGSGVSAWLASGFTITSGPGPVFAFVTNNATKVSGKAQWNYEVKETTFNGSNWSSGGSTITSNAKNLLESANTSTKAYGLDVLSPDGVTLSGFTGFAIQKVPITIVELKTDGTYFFFSAPNPITGTC